MTDLRVLSLGAGVQSSALYLMAIDGEFESCPDVAIFADTQQEPPWVYENLHRLHETGGDTIPIHIATSGDLGDHVQNATDHFGDRFASVPFWVEANDGTPSPGRRQCTREFKIDAIKRHVRRLLGLRKGQRAAGRFQVEEWVGISLDEVIRAKPSRYSWIITRWPFLLDKPMRRWEIERYLSRRGWGEIKKSACVFCPYRSDAEWLRWKHDEPEVFEDACAWDDHIRENGSGMNRLQYVSRTLKPLRLLSEDDIDDDDGQVDLFGNECEGMCGV